MYDLEVFLLFHELTEISGSLHVLDNYCYSVKVILLHKWEAAFLVACPILNSIDRSSLSLKDETL